MGIRDDIEAIRADNSRSEQDRKHDVYGVKTNALRGIIQPMLGQTIEHEGFTFCINLVTITPERALELNVTYTRPPASPVTESFVIVNPPVLPRNATGRDDEDLTTAVREMLESITR